jgi:hypothetical protein
MIDFTRKGRMIGPSKSGYHDHHPTNETYFNANLATRSAGKVWYGDIDLTLDREELQRYANELGEELFLLRERDGRFGNEVEIPFDRAVATFAPMARI